MATMLTRVMDVLRTRRGGHPCLVCGRPVGDEELPVRLRHEGRVHRGCATYSLRRRPEGAARLGYPRARQ